MSTPKFEPYPKGKDQHMWQHFLRDEKGENAKCIKCKTIIKTAGGSTSGLHKHLRNVHSIHKRPPTETEDVAPKKQVCLASQITNFYKKTPREDETLASVVAQMVAQDGLPIRLLITSVGIRKGLIARNFLDLPTSAETFRRMIVLYHKKIATELSTEFQRLKVMFITLFYVNIQI